MTNDDDNPTWSEDDFAQAKGPEDLPAHFLAAFPNTVARLGKEENVSHDLTSVLMRQAPGARLTLLAA